MLTPSVPTHPLRFLSPAGGLDIKGVDLVIQTQPPSGKFSGKADSGLLYLFPQLRVPQQEGVPARRCTIS